MQRSVKQHIEDLELLMWRLNDELMEQQDVQVRNELEAKIRAAELALTHFRTALEVEQSLSARRCVQRASDTEPKTLLQNFKRRLIRCAKSAG